MKNKKILILSGHDELFLINKNSEIDYELPFSSNSIFNRIARKNKYFIKYALGCWNKKLEEYNVIICIDSLINKEFLRYLESVKGIRKIIYFRNKISWLNKADIEYFKKNFEIWSYNLHDCIKHNIKYSCEMGNISIYKKKNNFKLEYSTVFVGFDKGRSDELTWILENFKKRDFFVYIPDKKDYRFNNISAKGFISYNEYVDICRKSKSIIDLVSEANYGLTLRAVEAMFLRKKLITNYKEIVYYDFYKKENVFVIGKDNINEISNFIDSPYVEINEEITERYTSDKWIENMISGKDTIFEQFGKNIKQLLDGGDGS